MRTLRTEREGRVMTVTLENPPRQLQSRTMTFELFELLKQLERDRSIGAVVITGAHSRSFLTHYDVAEILAGARITPDLSPRAFGALLRVVGLFDRLPGGGRLLDNRRTGGLLANRRVHQVYLAMNEMDKVFIAAINGTAAAGGCELALACDIRLMADGDFTIGLTEPVLGFNPGGGGGQRLARAVGSARAVEMLLEARHYSPREAAAAGLVHRVVEPERLLEEAHATARRLARRSRRAIWGSKRVAYRGPSSRWPGGFQLDRTGFLWGAVAPSTKRAMQGMLDQIERAPHDVPSPWHHPDQLAQWQEGMVADFSE
jgi:enoyl-CoA hydratase/carnithine racemase